MCGTHFDWRLCMICIENVMYAVQNSLNQWRRGIVVHAFEEDSKRFYTVYCIDYGYTEILTGNG